jgi:hypothetical protein
LLLCPLDFISTAAMASAHCLACQQIVRQKMESPTTIARLHLRYYSRFLCYYTYYYFVEWYIILIGTVAGLIGSHSQMDFQLRRLLLSHY